MNTERPRTGRGPSSRTKPDCATFLNIMLPNFAGHRAAGIAFLMLLSASLFGQPQATDQILRNVASIHGAAGVFAVAGYRMGERALKELDLPRGSFSIEVVHHTPMEVQWSCVADGLQAATGASAGKLNLRLVEATSSQSETVVTNRKTGKQVTFRLRPDFLRRFLDTPTEKQTAAGRDVAEMPEAKIFTMEVGIAPAKRQEAAPKAR